MLGFYSCMMFYKVMAIYTAACFSVLKNLLLNGFFVLSVVCSLDIFALLGFFLPPFPCFFGGFYTLPASFWFKIWDTLKVSQ